MNATRRNALLAGAGAGLMAAPAILRAETAQRWRMVTSWPRDLPGPGMSATRLARRIEALSGGRIAVQLHAAGEIVPAFEVLDAVSEGVAELAHTAAVFWAGKMPVSQLFLAVPFGLTPLEHAAWIEHGGGQALWDELYGDFGVRPFMAGNTGMSMGGWFRHEIHAVSDLRGLRFRMPGLGGDLYQPMGIVQVSLPPGETLPALQSGAIDAAEFAGPFSDLALGFYQAAPYYYGPGLHEPNGTGECIVNRRVFEALPGDLQAVVTEACRAENAFALAESERMNAEALKSLVEDHGVHLRRFPPEIVEALRARAPEVLGQFAEHGGLDKRIHDSYVAMLELLRPWSSESMAAYLTARAAA
jgi:TRAP-type mannitol/chloroaromatic compound transport system substrate-binding protein